jgi:hypothetical protein
MAATLRDDHPVAKPARPCVRYAVGVTNRPLDPHLRRAARVLALAPALLVTGTAGAAVATPPSSWEDTPHVSALYVILVLVAIPVGLFVLITLLVYVPSMSHGEHYQPGQAWRGEPEWFGGPRGGLETADRTAPPAAVTDGQSAPIRGGSSGHW